MSRCSGFSASPWSSSSASGSRRSSSQAWCRRSGVGSPAAWIVLCAGLAFYAISSGVRCARFGSHSAAPISSSPSASRGSPLRFRPLSSSISGTSAGGSVTSSRSSGSRQWASRWRTIFVAASRAHAPCSETSAARTSSPRPRRFSDRTSARSSSSSRRRTRTRKSTRAGSRSVRRRSATSSGSPRAASRPRDRGSPARHRQALVPDAILKKPGPLTDAEFHVVMGHVHAGVALLRELGGFSEMVHRLVRGHHERLDGSGYPRAVAGDPIPLDVGILAVCDVYDALISERVYRPAGRTSARSSIFEKVRTSSSTGRASRRWRTFSRASGTATSRSRSSSPSRACRGDRRGRAAGRSGRRRRARPSLPA